MIDLDIISAAQRLSDRLADIERSPEYHRVFQLAQDVGAPYNGPTYGIELDLLNQLLSKANVVEHQQE